MGSVLYEKVLYHLDLVETEYFGLQFSDTSNVNVSYSHCRSERRTVTRRCDVLVAWCESWSGTTVPVIRVVLCCPHALYTKDLISCDSVRK